LFEGADSNTIEVLDEVVHADYVDHNPPPFASQTPGLPGARETWGTATTIFSDWSHEVVQQFSAGDYVMTQIVGRGKHSGDVLGYRASHVLVTDDGKTVVNVAVFDSKESYLALADDPAQDTWWQTRFAPMLAGEPQWIDGDWIK